MKPLEKDSGQENWHSEGQFVTCRHDDCHYYIRQRSKHKDKRRLLARFYPDRVEFKCDSCGQKSTYYFDKSKQPNGKVDEPKWIPLESLIKEWESNK